MAGRRCLLHPIHRLAVVVEVKVEGVGRGDDVGALAG